MKGQNIRVDVALEDVRIMKESYALYGVLIRIVRQDSGHGPEQVYEQHVYRRYSEFLDLKNKLEKQFGAELPYELPGRRFGWKRSAVDPYIIEERKTQLAKFLKDMLNDSFDTKWKNSEHVSKFLKLSAGWNATAGESGSRNVHQTHSLDLSDAAQWMTKLKDSKTILEQARRAGSSERSKLLMELRLDLYNMEAGLREQSQSRQIGETEAERRSNLLSTLKRDVNEMALEQAHDADSYSGSGREPTADDDDRVRSALFPDSVAQRSPKKPLAGRRKFGETGETEQLDNRQLLQLHKSKMQDQDKELEEMRKIIQRQKNLSIEMNQELAQQNDLLDLLGNDVDDTATRLRVANRKAKQFNSD
ncbi:hypothetical protein HG536_0D05550 [Torulaspora globosa]|uniref:PX domain-containing protein n=1 Tax=Torulaspora globosa TaxID=48254 RepID=A0A7G3ZHP8_9SACH|nr:uncharacterized protein HG536_0D05550 [Torulaspora globosa]QLL33034.1 hypothetical protein HG536_0D05550 [Torulaspora globosa]